MRHIWVLVAAFSLVGCGADQPTAIEPPRVELTQTTAAATGCADVIGASAEQAADGTYAFRVTVRSADTGPEKHADAWELRAPDGTVLGTRVLLHDHVNEQPFTRSLSGVEIPAGVTDVVIAARDSVAGFCGETFTLALG